MMKTYNNLQMVKIEFNDSQIFIRNVQRMDLYTDRLFVVAYEQNALFYYKNIKWIAAGEQDEINRIQGKYNGKIFDLYFF